MAKHHENKDEHQHDALMLNKTCTRTEQAVAGLQRPQLLALRAIKSKVHAPAQHQTTTSQSCTVPRLQHSLPPACKMLIPARHPQPSGGTLQRISAAAQSLI